MESGLRQARGCSLREAHCATTAGMSVIASASESNTATARAIANDRKNSPTTPVNSPSGANTTTVVSVDPARPDRGSRRQRERGRDGGAPLAEKQEEDQHRQRAAQQHGGTGPLGATGGDSLGRHHAAKSVILCDMPGSVGAVRSS